MKIQVTAQLKVSLHHVLQRAGYHLFNDRKFDKQSYALRLGAGHYPRFHVYISNQAAGSAINLHLDQKKPSYAGSHAHSGEYDGELVEAEAQRLKRWLQYFSEHNA